MARLGIVTGLLSETRVLGAALDRSGGGGEVAIRCAGANADRARAHATDLVDSGARALLSFGVAGAIDPALRPGALIATDRIGRGPGATESPDAAWLQSFLSCIEPREKVHIVDIADSDTLVSTVVGKRGLYEQTGGGAVDMESVAVAGVARSAGIPFLIVRAIADPASRAPPPEALATVAADGGIRHGVAIKTLLRKPGSISIYLRLAADNRAALATLRRVAALGAPFFGLV